MNFKIIINCVVHQYNLYHAIFDSYSFIKQLPEGICTIYFENLDKNSVLYKLFSLFPEKILISDFEEPNMDIIDYKSWDFPFPYNQYIGIRNYYNKFLKNSIDKNKNIYISRKYNHLAPTHKNISARHIINEDQIYNDILKPNGFKFIEMETLTVEEQINLFNDANTVISPHGAALVLSLFSNPNTKIVEILPKDNRMNHGHFKNICEVLNINYFIYNTIQQFDYELNMTVDSNNFENFLVNNSIIEK